MPQDNLKVGHRTKIRPTRMLGVLLLVLAPVLAWADTPESAKLGVFVSILPQTYLAARVGGELVDVDALVGPGASPEVYEPTPKQLARLAEARILFRVGMPFERMLIEKIAALNPQLRIVDCREGIRLRYLTESEVPEAGENDGHVHPPGTPDPHFWLSLKNGKIMAETMCRVLSEVDPTHAEPFADNLARLEQDLDQADARIARWLAPIRGAEFYVYHPAFGYFADAYGLRQVAVETGGKEPSARQLADLIERAKRANARVIFVQRQFPVKSAQAVADAIGSSVVVLDPLSPDYIANLEAIARAILRSYGREPETQRVTPPSTAEAPAR